MRASQSMALVTPIIDVLSIVTRFKPGLFGSWSSVLPSLMFGRYVHVYHKVGLMLLYYINILLQAVHLWHTEQWGLLIKKCFTIGTLTRDLTRESRSKRTLLRTLNLSFDKNAYCVSNCSQHSLFKHEVIYRDKLWKLRLLLYFKLRKTKENRI